MKFVMIVLISFLVGCQSMTGERSLAVSMRPKIRVNVTRADLGELGARLASKYRFDIRIMDRAGMDSLAGTLFDQSRAADADTDESLFCVVRIRTECDESFDFIAHHVGITVLDEDLSRHGMPHLKVGFVRSEEIDYQVFRLTVFGDVRDRLLNKKQVELRIETLRFG